MSERAKAKMEDRAAVQRQAKLDFAQRLEKVWKQSEAVVARCEREYENLKETSAERTASFTAAELERRERAMEAARARAESARDAWERCLAECGVKVPDVLGGPARGDDDEDEEPLLE